MSVLPTFSEDTIAMILITNIVTNKVAKGYIHLEIALAVWIQQKSLIGHSYGYHLTCSYDEILYFRTSVAVWSANRQTDDVISHKFSNKRRLFLLQYQ